ncbi:TRAP transporter small permease subunit [Mycolicibacterium hippocampi]|uniref:C4-dicarboxylate ABC transporter substrate-binding protein n=1 Tax=Mycolicibacterium hippocampi TaxID=659824 RepID=A0A7I9ZIG7_9MYCO|nr:TRAP transporter small permease [Mycolicibacterium hippocampi]GFH00623.1 C4-dicarboxylate ABC transporter substrate-binding protein [Mycolicibacterium hippocampi]
MTEDVTLPRPVLVVARTLSVVAGILLVGLILLTIADVVSRNFRDRSIVGTVEIATMLLVAIAFLGLASAEADGRHVVVELFESRFGVRTRMVFSVLRTLLLIGLGVLLTWGLSEVLLSAVERGETTNDILRLPTWPAKVVLLASFVLFFAVAVWREVLTISALRAEPSGAHR